MGGKSIKDVNFENVKLQDCLKGDLEIIPLRTLDEFILGSAKFQIPNYKNPQRWWNRVYKNLYYYQTNYFFTGAAIFTYFLLVHTTKLLYGMILTFNVIKLLIRLTNNQNFKAKELVGLCIGVVLLRVFEFNINYALSCIILFWTSILTILCVTIVHASLRLRNFSNKVVNFLEGEKRTPMTVLIFMSIDYLAILAKWMMRKSSTRNQNFALRNCYTNPRRQWQ